MSDFISQPRLRLAPGTPWRKWLVRVAWTFATLYLVLDTYAWVVLYGLFIALFAPGLPQSKFSETMWCKPGEWVLDTFQPMVSDARMIRQVNANRADMEKAALMTINRTDVDSKGMTAESKLLLKSIDLALVGLGESLPANPNDINRVFEQERCVRDAPSLEHRRSNCFKEKRSISVLKLDFGRTWAQHFCTDSCNSSKSYPYFPAPSTRIQDGKLLGPINAIGSSGSRLLVPNADRNLDGGSIARQIDEYWFISRN